jgi:hypothetical protein
MWVSLSIGVTASDVDRQADCNFFSFRVDGQGSVLEANGSWYLGDFINKLLPGIHPRVGQLIATA